MNAPVEPGLATADPALAIDRLLVAQRRAFATERYPSAAVRRDRLRRLLAFAREREAAIADAIAADFGHRSRHETRLGETYLVAAAARHAMRHVARWMRPRPVPTPLALMPGRAFVLPQPLGVVGIISPWNYPFQLAMIPAAGALAAGNRVMIKPSELTPRTSALIGEEVARRFAPEEMTVVEGDAATGRAFAAAKLDHLFFTGSTAVGRAVARAAADNLVPVTLELGGKSPALVDVDADFDVVVPRLVVGKLFNAGQTCIAPDYALVPASRLDAFVAAVRAAAGRLYPNVTGNADYTSILSERHFERLQALVGDARGKGATVIEIGPDACATAALPRRMAPTLITGVTDAMDVMQQEIFGPLLPVETYATLDEAIERIEARPRPLAFYYFGRDRTRLRRVLEQTAAGGVTVNDTLWHFAHEALPFGGVGDSGSGAYHGERSFRTFSHDKAVFSQPRFAPSRLLAPPYGQAFEAVLAFLKRLNG